MALEKRLVTDATLSVTLGCGNEQFCSLQWGARPFSRFRTLTGPAYNFRRGHDAQAGSPYSCPCLGPRLLFLLATMKFDRIESIVIVGIGIAFVLIALVGLWQLF